MPAAPSPRPVCAATPPAKTRARRRTRLAATCLMAIASSRFQLLYFFSFIHRNDRRRLSLPGESVTVRPADVRHQRRPETGDARPALAANARIDDAERAGREQALGQRLRGDVAVRIEARAKAARRSGAASSAARLGGCRAEVVQGRAEISKVGIIDDGIFGAV